MDGVEATRRIRGRSPNAKILILTTFDEDELVFEAVRAGVLRYMLKDASGAELVAAIRNVASGGAALHPSVARKVIDAFARLAQPSPQTNRHLAEPSSGREQAVLRRLTDADLEYEEMGIGGDGKDRPRVDRG